MNEALEQGAPADAEKAVAGPEADGKLLAVELPERTTRLERVRGEACFNGSR